MITIAEICACILIFISSNCVINAIFSRKRKNKRNRGGISWKVLKKREREIGGEACERDNEGGGARNEERGEEPEGHERKHLMTRSLLLQRKLHRAGRCRH